MMRRLKMSLLALWVLLLTACTFVSPSGQATPVASRLPTAPTTGLTGQPGEPVLTVTRTVPSPMASPPPTNGPDLSSGHPPVQVVYTCAVFDLCLSSLPGTTVNLTNLSSAIVSDFVVSPDGRTALFVRQARDARAGEVWRVDLVSHQSQRVPGFDAPRAVNGISLSESGAAVFVLSPPDLAFLPSEADELWQTTAEDDRARPVKVNSTDASVHGWRWPKWSRDGRFLFVNRFDASQERILYALDMGTLQLQKIAAGVRLLEQSPDGRKLLLISAPKAEGEPSSLWIADWPMTASPVRLTPVGQTDTSAHWAADGSEILFAFGDWNSQGFANPRIGLMRADGTHRRSITDEPATTPHWLAGGSGRYVLFLGARSSAAAARFELWLLDLETGQARSLGQTVNWDYVSVNAPG